MQGPGLQPGQAKLTQPCAHRALVHHHGKPTGDFRAQVDTAPAHHLVQMRVGARDHQRLQFSFLDFRQQRRAARTAARSQARDPLVVVAMHPVPQGLPVHAAPLRRVPPGIAVQHEGNRQQPTNLRRVATLARRRPKRRCRVLRPGDRQRLRHPTSPSRESSARKIESEPHHLGNPPRVTVIADWYQITPASGNTHRVMLSGLWYQGDSSIRPMAAPAVQPLFRAGGAFLCEGLRHHTELRARAVV